jgi:hypothetical protein
MAKITLSYPGWKEGNVLPATIEVPVEPLSWQGLFLDYLIWPLGAAIIAVIGWIIRRIWRYVARRRHARIEDQRTEQAVRSAAMRNAVSRAEEEP